MTLDFLDKDAPVDSSHCQFLRQDSLYLLNDHCIRRNQNFERGNLGKNPDIPEFVVAKFNLYLGFVQLSISSYGIKTRIYLVDHKIQILHNT